jgi:hypothetical protein
LIDDTGGDAVWFFNFSVPGDVVGVCNTGPPLRLDQNGDWTIPMGQRQRVAVKCPPE